MTYKWLFGSEGNKNEINNARWYLGRENSIITYRWFEKICTRQA